MKIENLPPNLDQDYVIGSNQFKLEIDGFVNINSPLQVKLKFDKNKVPKGRSYSSIVAAFILYNNTWLKPDYIIDEPNEMIILVLNEEFQSKIIKGNQLHNTSKAFIITDSYNKILGEINDNEICDCGWEVDFSNLTKIDNNEENNVYYIGKDGKKNGPSIYWWNKERTILMLSYCYLNDKEHGIVKSFWSNGSIMGETNYSNGNKDGYYNLYFENGIKSVEGNYKNDLMEGQWLSWYENGNIFKEIYYENGLENGFYKFWFENGKLSSQGNHKQGKKHGKWKEFYDNGNTWIDHSFDEGILNGKFTEYWDNGNKWNEGYYRNGEQVGIWWYYDKYGKCLKGYDFDKNEELICQG
jgi:antitoxin component YwqK of YwqJK toxin-antitoxin module